MMEKKKTVKQLKKKDVTTKVKKINPKASDKPKKTVKKSTKSAKPKKEKGSDQELLRYFMSAIDSYDPAESMSNDGKDHRIYYFVDDFYDERNNKIICGVVMIRPCRFNVKTEIKNHDSFTPYEDQKEVLLPIIEFIGFDDNTDQDAYFDSYYYNYSCAKKIMFYDKRQIDEYIEKVMAEEY